MAQWTLSDGTVVNYKEYVVGREESYSKQQTRVVKVYDVTDDPDVDYTDPANTTPTGWSLRWKFAAELLGYPRLKKAGTTDAYLERVTPNHFGQLRLDTQKPWLFATQFSIKGQGRPTWDDQKNEGNYKAARITVTYEPLSYPVREDSEIAQDSNGNPTETKLERYVTRTYQPTAQFLTLPRNAYLWVPDKAPIDQSNGILQTAVQLTYTWHEVPVIPDAIFSHLGAVNQSTFDEFDPGTLFLYGAAVKPQRLASGQRVYEVTWMVKFFEPENLKGHNYFLRYRPGTNSTAFELITSDGTAGGKTVFQPMDYKLLFTPNGSADPI